MTTTLRARFDGRVLVPEEPVDLPKDCVLEVRVEPFTPEQSVEPCESPTQRLAKLAMSFPDNSNAPVDGAAQHDHYLYGTPKRE